ncbi:MAG: DUF429 domain-containing protein [Acidimicrobiia bacterium]
MHAVGIDLAAGAATTGVVIVGPVSSGRWRATEVPGPADDDMLVLAARSADVVGVDSPLGWPVAFVEAVSAHARFERWPGTIDRSTLTHRDTDRAVRRLGIRSPLSVSADRLGSVAMRCALLQQRWAEEAWAGAARRDGSDRLVETYPAAAFAAWGIECRHYKQRDDPGAASRARAAIVEAMAAALGRWLDLGPVRERCLASDHVLDALVCALVAVASKRGATHQPSAAERAAAIVEGWVHVPSRPLVELPVLD